MTDDGQLLHQYLKDKSDAAFAELVRRHLGLVYHSALRQLGGDAHGANDDTQEVFIQLARYASSVRFHPTLAGWLYQTTHFKVREEIRARRRRQIREQKAQLMHEQSVMPEPAVAWEQLRPILDEIVMGLGPTDREAVILRYFKGQSFSAIGAELGLTEDTAQKRVDRALDKLRGSLAKKEISSSAKLPSDCCVARNRGAWPRPPAWSSASRGRRWPPSPISHPPPSACCNSRARPRPPPVRPAP